MRNRSFKVIDVCCGQKSIGDVSAHFAEQYFSMLAFKMPLCLCVSPDRNLRSMLSPVCQHCWCQIAEALLLGSSSPPFPPWQEQSWQPGDAGSKQWEAYEEVTVSHFNLEVSCLWCLVWRSQPTCIQMSSCVCDIIHRYTGYSEWKCAYRNESLNDV